MIYRIAFIMLMSVATIITMEHPRGFEMQRDSSPVQKLRGSNKKSDSACDCLDVIRRSECLLQQYQVTDGRNPLRRKDTVHCCGECCEITNECADSTVLLCAPQACLCAALYIMMHATGQICSSIAPSCQSILLASLGGTVCISSCVSMRNKMLTEKKES